MASVGVAWIVGSRLRRKDYRKHDMKIINMAKTITILMYTKSQVNRFEILLKTHCLALKGCLEHRLQWKWGCTGCSHFLV